MSVALENYTYCLMSLGPIQTCLYSAIVSSNGSHIFCNSIRGTNSIIMLILNKGNTTILFYRYRYIGKRSNISFFH